MAFPPPASSKGSNAAKTPDLDPLGLLDALPGLVWKVDPEGNLTWANRACLAFSGKPLSEIQGRFWPVALFRADIQSLEAITVHQGRPDALNLEIYSTGLSHTAWFDANLLPQFASDGSLASYIGLATNITSRKAEEQRLLADNNRYQAFITTGQTLLWRTNAEGQTTHIYNWEHLALSDPSDILARNRRTWVHPEDIPNVSTARATALETGQPFSCEIRLLHKAEGYQWYLSRATPIRDAQGQIVEWIGSTENIHHRKLAEQKIAQADKRYHTFYQVTTSGIIFINRVGRITTTNPATAIILDCPIEALQNRFLHESGWEVVHDNPVDRSNGLEYLANLASTTNKPAEGVVKLRRHSDHQHRWLEVTALPPERNEIGRPEGTFYVLRDITNAQLASRAHDLMATTINHRARNILANVRALVSLTRAPDVTSFRTSLTGRITAIAQAYGTLLDEGWTGADLNTLIADELAPYAPHLGQMDNDRSADTATTVTLDGHPIRLTPDVVQPLAIILHELTTNAAKHGCLSRPDGLLGISWSITARGLEITWHETASFVIDRGDLRPGLGLSLVTKTISSQLGGSVDFEWRPNGLTAQLRLPITSLAKQALHIPPVPSEDPGTTNNQDGTNAIALTEEISIQTPDLIHLPRPISFAKGMQTSHTKACTACSCTQTILQTLFNQPLEHTSGTTSTTGD